MRKLSLRGGKRLRRTHVRQSPGVPAAAARLAIVGLIGSTFLLAACSTPGPLHLYSIAPAATTIHDTSLDHHDTARDGPSYLDAGDELTGFAYDPFADHFFLRLAPGNRIRVVDRPARKIKREFTITGAPADGGEDLALNPRTGHLYLLDRNAPQVVAATRLGKFLQSITLADRADPAVALAFDPTDDELVALNRDAQTVERYDLSGAHRSTIRLARPVKPSLAFSADTRLLYAPLADDSGHVGAFDTTGQLVQTIAIPPGDQFIDVGPHSFLRIF